MKNCLWCGNDYPPVRSDQKFCKDKCKKAWHRLAKKICEMVGLRILGGTLGTITRKEMERAYESLLHPPKRSTTLREI